jgi:hypothetical protein
MGLDSSSGDNSSGTSKRSVAGLVTSAAASDPSLLTHVYAEPGMRLQSITVERLNSTGAGGREGQGGAEKDTCS